MGIVCLAGIFAVFLLLAWTLCRAAGWGRKNREDLEQEQYLKEWREKKLKKIEKNLKISVDIWRVECYTNEVGW